MSPKKTSRFLLNHDPARHLARATVLQHHPAAAFLRIKKDLDAIGRFDAARLKFHAKIDYRVRSPCNNISTSV